MSDSSTFGGTLTGGIQDISALLPLLGTEQCEAHVGSSLDKGFLYSAVTPISIFGSLGIVRASLNILGASVNIPRLGFSGARALNDGGFRPSGTVAPMIALDPGRLPRFLAETRLDAMLAKKYIGNVNEAKASWEDDIVLWNFRLVVCTLVTALTGLVPYIPLVVKGDPRNFFPLGFGYPILRVFGSAVCVVVAQFLIQIRVLFLLKNKLLAVSMAPFDNLNERGGAGHPAFGEVNMVQGEERQRFDLRASIESGNMDIRGGVWVEQPDARLNLSAEQYVWKLREQLAQPGPQDQRDALRALDEHHFAPPNPHIPPWLTPCLCSILAFGCISTVVGYIGCFFLIQHSTSTKGTLLWLVLEAILSVLRIFGWAVNPKWDDPRGVYISTRRSVSRPPIITCNVPLQDVITGAIETRLTRSDVFLRDVVAYAGPLAVETPDTQHVELYYVLAAGSGQHEADTKSLLVVISICACKGQQDLMLFYDNRPQAVPKFLLYRCSIHPAPGTTGFNVKVGEETDFESNFLMSNQSFTTQLLAHYCEIVTKLQIEIRPPQDRQETRLRLSWALQLPQSNQLQPAVETILPPLQMTPDDHAYFECGFVTRRLPAARRLLEELLGNQVRAYSSSLIYMRDDIPLLSTRAARGEDVEASLSQQYNALQRQLLLYACQAYLEASLFIRVRQWYADVKRSHAQMVDIVSHPPTDSDNQPPSNDPSQAAPFVSVNVDENKTIPHDRSTSGMQLATRLDGELAILLKQDVADYKKNMTLRVTTPSLLDGDVGRELAENLRDELVQRSSQYLDFPLDRATEAQPSADSDDLVLKFPDIVSEKCRELYNNNLKSFPRAGSGPSSGTDDKILESMQTMVQNKANQLFKMLSDLENSLHRIVQEKPGVPSNLDLGDKKFDMNQFKHALNRVSDEWKETVEVHSSGTVTTLDNLADLGF